jgi:hypothetical protein
MACRLFRKAVQQGRSERRGDAYSVPYVEPLSDVRTPLADFVNSLLIGDESLGREQDERGRLDLNCDSAVTRSTAEAQCRAGSLR